MKNEIYLIAAPRAGATLFQKVLATDEKLAADIHWDPMSFLDPAQILEKNPGAKFIFVTRNPVQLLSSLMDAWRSQLFVTNPDLANWWGEKWSFGLTDNWQEVVGKPIVEVAAHQYLYVLEKMSAALAAHGDISVLTSLEALLATPTEEINRIVSKLGITWDGKVPSPLPMPTNTRLAPGKEKVKRNFPEIMSIGEAFSKIQVLENELRTSHGVEVTRFQFDPQVKEKAVSRPSEGTAFHSTHTNSVAKLFELTKTSMVISTYKSGHLILLRREGDKVNTTFQSYPRPMGVAVAGSRLAVGTADAILSYSNQPGLRARLNPEDKPDAIYAPRAITYTGDVSMHEMAYDANGDLWFVNTKFSCLSKQNIDYSFTCEWKPEWITRLAAEDRCHLNGMAMVDGKVRYVTALAKTDSPAGWRDHKGTSGVLIDITDNRTVAEGLSMPHSPRWYQGKLYILESGKGTLATVDVNTGAVETIAELPGFTRGLTFVGPYAIVGLSQVRETIFKELPLTEKAEERNCGVWIVDLRDKSIAGFVKFHGAVQEIFDVQVLPGFQWPMIMDRSEETMNSFVLSEEVLKLVNVEKK